MELSRSAKELVLLMENVAELEPSICDHLIANLGIGDGVNRGKKLTR
jgi:hypothetical protein